MLKHKNIKQLTKLSFWQAVLNIYNKVTYNIMQATELYIICRFHGHNSIIVYVSHVAKAYV